MTAIDLESPRTDLHLPFYFGQVVVHDGGHGCGQLSLDVAHLAAVHVDHHHSVAVVLILRLAHQGHHLPCVHLRGGRGDTQDTPCTNLYRYTVHWHASVEYNQTKQTTSVYYILIFYIF